MNLRTALSATLIAAASIVGASHAHADESYPNRSVRMLVGFAPGALTDQLARLYAQKLGSMLGSTFVVDNRPGAGGNVAVKMLTQAEPDGYTIMMAANYVAINEALGKNNYRWDQDLQPIALIASTPNLVVVPLTSPYKSVQDLIAASKSGTKLTYGSSGIGTTMHMSAELFDAMSGTHMIHIPYKGAAPAEVDLISGTFSLMFDSITTAAPLVHNGKIKALATTGKEPSPYFPDLPTVQEAGLKGYDVEAVYMLLAPAKTPPEIVKKLTDAVKAISNDASTKEILKGFYTTQVQGGPQETMEFLKSEVKKWTELVKTANIKVE